MDGQPTAQNQSATDAVRDITDAGKQMFQAGQRIASNLETLEERLDHATDWRAQFSERPWMMVGAAVLGGFLLYRLFRR